MKGADVGDADRGPRNGENQRGQRVHRAPPRRLGPRHDPRHRHPDDETDQDGQPREHERVDDELGRLDAHLPEVVERVVDREGRQRPALADRGEQHADLRHGRHKEQRHEEANRQPALHRPELPPLHLGVGERAVVLDRHVVARDQHEYDGEDHHQCRDHDAHAEDAPVDELHDVEVGLHGEEILHAHHERRDEVGEGPDEDEQRPRDVAGCRQRQGDVPEAAPSPRPHPGGRFLEGRIDLGQRVEDGECHQGKQVHGLDQQHPVHPVHEVDRVVQTEPVVQQHVHRARPPQYEDEPEHAHERRQDHRQHREIAEEVTVGKLVADDEERDRDPDHRGRDDRGDSQHQRIPERAQVEAVGKKFLEIHERELPRFVGERVVEDARQGIEQKDDEKRPDQAESDH